MSSWLLDRQIDRRPRRDQQTSHGRLFYNGRTFAAIPDCHYLPCKSSSGKRCRGGVR
jgi:hypothetical protein